MRCQALIPSLEELVEKMRARGIFSFYGNFLEP
jgi:hypothetical protein